MGEPSRRWKEEGGDLEVVIIGIECRKLTADKLVSKMMSRNKEKMETRPWNERRRADSQR